MKLSFKTLGTILFLAITSQINAQISFVSNGQNITSNNSWDIRLADIDGDGDLDACFEQRVWLNDGKGQFTKTTTTFGSSDYVCFADFNGDNHTDVVCLDKVFLWNEGKHIYDTIQIISDIVMYSMYVADLDEDGDKDIISCSETSDRILWNDGSGNFTNSGISLGGWAQASYATGDLNGDGTTDIYVAIPHTPPPTMVHSSNKIWFGDAGKNFTLKNHDIPGAESRGVIIADFNADGNMELFVSDRKSWGRLYLNDGKGNFTDDDQKIGSHTVLSASADFDNDGDLDLFICQNDGNSNGAPFSKSIPSIVMTNDGKGKFTDSGIKLGTSNSMSVAVGDLNNDEKTDAFVVNVKLNSTTFVTEPCPVEIWLNKTFICDYFGQTPPGDTAVIFASGIISKTNRFESDITVSPDGNEVYFNAGDGNSTGIYYTKHVNNVWSEQLIEPTFNGFQQPTFSANGQKMYLFKYNTSATISNLWVSERITGGWGAPQILPVPINNPNSRTDGYSEISDSVRYISSNRSGNGAIWCIRRLIDQSFHAEKLDLAMDSYNIGNPVIAPDGSYLIFDSDHKDNDGNSGFYVSFKKENDEWTVPINLEKSKAKINNSNYFQIYPSLSPDGKYLFFNRHFQVADVWTMDIYWVSTHILDTLKKIAMPAGLVHKTNDEKVILYPNPTKGPITLSLGTSQNQEALIEIYNLLGTKIFSKTYQNTTSTTIDLTGNTKGIYMVKVIADGNIYNEKISVK
jgi:hypothetical protein